MTSGDWLPRTRAARLSLALEWSSLLTQNRTRWGIPQEYRSAFSGGVSDADAALQEVLDPTRNTSVTREHCSRLFKALVASMRDMKKRYFLMPPLTEEDIIALGLKLHDVKPSSHPAPKDKPVLEALPKGRGLHVLTVLNPNTNTKDKPEFVTGVVFAIRIRNANEPQALAKDMPDCFQASVTRKIQWEETDYGKVVDYACAYENAKGERGPWSEVVSVLIG